MYLSSPLPAVFNLQNRAQSTMATTAEDGAEERAVDAEAVAAEATN